LLHQGKSLYHLDEALLAELKPDLILTQELCDVCAVSYNIVLQAAKILAGEPEIISLEPHTIWDILENIRLVGEKAGKTQEANRLVASCKQRIAAVQEKTADLASRPRVYCMEWLEPPFAAGHWIYEMVEIAGGYEALARAGKPSEAIAWQEVLAYAPEVLILMPCGFDLDATIAESQRLQDYAGWPAIPAVENGAVFAVDGSGYFNRPGPRIVDGLEILAQIIHPELFSFPHILSGFQKPLNLLY
jgi:iron complex transport system substrate-binding protein